MLIGGFVSAAGGIDKAILRADENGFEVAMFFIGSPHSWKLPHLSKEEAQKVKETQKLSHVKRTYSHALYLANLATDNKEQFDKTVKALTTTVQNGNLIDLEGVIFHPGSHKGTSIKEGIKRVADGITQVLSNATGTTKLILEFVVEQGDKVGTSFEQLEQIIDLVPKEYQNRVSVCYDTCHGFAMGYDYKDSNSMEKLISDIKSTIGLEKLDVFHVNDSQTPLNSHKDRHANIGKGYIGLEGFKALLNSENFKDKDFILEVPGLDNKGPSKKDRELLLSLIN